MKTCPPCHGDCNQGRTCPAHSLKSSDQRCDGQIPADPKDEICKRRDTCQRYIAHKTDFSNRTVAWMIPTRNCSLYIGAKNA